MSMLYGMWTLIWFSSTENNKYSLLAAARMNLLDSRNLVFSSFLSGSGGWHLDLKTKNKKSQLPAEHLGHVV